MKTKIIPQSDVQSSATALEIIRNGGVVAVPTDTVYGIACAVTHPAAIKQLYAIKERDALKAIPVLVGDLQQVEKLTANFTKQAERLSKELWPGALTIIVPKAEHLPVELSAYDTVGIRMPDHDWLRELMLLSGPLAATSANLSGAPSPATAKEVLAQLDGRIELIVDGGECKGGIPSTVVDCSRPEIKILREGGISPERIYNLLSQS
jgi:L-threonylcarbamoyladenylate synthase